MRHAIFTVAIGMAAQGCAGRVAYDPPAPVQATTTVEVPLARSAVWDAMIAHLGKSWFVINVLDRSSGLINLTYRGNPDTHLECGRITSHVKNLAGTRNYDFPAASARQNYEVLEAGRLLKVDRSMALEGRVNLVLEAPAARRTRATVSAQYAVTRTVSVETVGGGAPPPPRSHTITFMSGEVGTFPAEGNAPTVACRSSGALENELLEMVRVKAPK